MFSCFIAFFVAQLVHKILNNSPNQKKIPTFSSQRFQNIFLPLRFTFADHTFYIRSFIQKKAHSITKNYVPFCVKTA